MAILFLDFFGSDPSKMDQTCKFSEQTSLILEFKPEGLDFQYIYIFPLQVTNAEEFKLPQELHPHENLPFSWKWKEERRDGNDTFPKNCAVCGKTSRGVPSVSCDFCPLVYHLDCLDPPLCEIPTVSIFSIWAVYG